MKNEEPILTRKSYRKQLEKNKGTKDAKVSKQDEIVLNSENEPSSSIRERLEQITPPKKGKLERYNRLLNRWIISMVILLILALIIQFVF